MMMHNKKQPETLKGYTKGQFENRPWGFYEVLKTGTENNQEFCEKKIGVKPFQALSLQRHHYRREYWEVLSGELTVIHKGEVMTLKESETINIELFAPHCMINMTDKPVVVYEKQTGLCREEDNDRLYDFSGRQTLEIAVDDHAAHKSKLEYLRITDFLHAVTNGSKDKAA